MVPAPNFLAGVLLGIANTSWLAVIVASFLWGFVFCGYLSIADSARKEASIRDFGVRARRLLLGSPRLTFYAIEFCTGFMTSLVVGGLTHFIKRMVT